MASEIPPSCRAKILGEYKTAECKLRSDNVIELLCYIFHHSYQALMLSTVRGGLCAEARAYYKGNLEAIDHFFVQVWVDIGEQIEPASVFSFLYYDQTPEEFCFGETKTGSYEDLLEALIEKLRVTG